MIQEIKNLFRHRYLLTELVKRDFRAKYIGSKVGLLWSLIAPVVRLLIFIFIFSVVLKVRFDAKEGITNFALYLVCGILPWFSFQQSIVRSETILLENSNLVKYIVFPAKIFPLYVVISSLVDQIIGLAFFVLAVILITQTLNILTLPFILVVLLFQLIFTLGLSWFFSTLNILFRDTFHMVDLALMVWMYLTPIFYPASLIPSGVKFIIKLNPMAYLIKFYRDILLRGKLPDTDELLVFLLIAIVVFLTGYYVFEKNQSKFADLI